MHLAAFDKCVLEVQNSRQYWIIQISRAVALLWEMDAKLASPKFVTEFHVVVFLQCALCVKALIVQH